ncbi:MAG: hypothetical protein IID16_07955 [Candidatus Marinimicrobia bacterium]|nr:hypothetical protein [Candidatus Neomarinimicrobiota bacterium]
MDKSSFPARRQAGVFQSQYINRWLLFPVSLPELTSKQGVKGDMKQKFLHINTDKQTASGQLIWRR